MTSVREIIAAEVASYMGTCQADSALLACWQNSGKSEAVEQAIIMKLHNLAGPCLQEGPSASLVADMILGRSPRELSGNTLTSREAHAWMHQSECDSPASWVWSQMLPLYPELNDVTCPSSVVVTKWLREVMGDPVRRKAAYRNRPTMALGGEIEGSLIERLDEIKAHDLSRSVSATLEAAVNRAIKDAWSGDDHLVDPLKWDPPKGIEEIHTFSRLYSEGQVMRHCVSQYASRIASKEGRILSVRASDDSRSTAWITPSYECAEHKAFANSAPSSACEGLVKQAVSLLRRSRG